MKRHVERSMRRMGESVTAKMGLIVILILLFLIPLGMIRSLVSEREIRRNNAVEEAGARAGGRVVTGGPILTVPYLVKREREDGKPVTLRRFAHVLPRLLEISGDVEPAERRRGIYRIPLYNATLGVHATFGPLEASLLGIDGGGLETVTAIKWEEAFLSLELPDMRALKETPRIRWDNRALTSQAAAPSLGIFPAAAHVSPGAVIPEQQTRFSGEARAELGKQFVAAHGISHNVDIELHLGGAIALSFLPLGETTRVALNSPWQSPSFNGFVLPKERTVGENGFTSRWLVLALNRGYPQHLAGTTQELDAIRASSFGVNFMLPVDHYDRTLRAVKYGILFILLPFVVLFLFELFLKRRLHPLHYTLIGFSEVVFYLLLLSVSEHLEFNLAFLVSAGATTSLVTFYATAVLEKKRSGFLLGPFLLLLYAFLFLILQSEDYALLLGSAGLFAILSLFMIITRKVDWYGTENSRETREQREG